MSVPHNCTFSSTGGTSKASTTDSPSVWTGSDLHGFKHVPEFVHEKPSIARKKALLLQ